MSAVASLLEILDLETLEVNLFRGRSPQDRWQRVFGGQVIGQALVAALRTVEDRPAHSLHCYFLLGGDPKVPIIYEVDRIRDGRSFTTRRVVAIQHGHAIFSMSVSFHTPEPGFSHAVKMPEVPPPEELPDERTLAMNLDEMPDFMRSYFQSEQTIERRPVEHEERYIRRPVTDGPEPVVNLWMRAAKKLPEDLAIHQCVLAYASDMSLLDVALVRHGRHAFERTIQSASLDHAMWFHAPFRADDWLLYVQESPWAGGARGFSLGHIFARDGRLVASVAQEGMIRPRPDLA